MRATRDGLIRKLLEAGIEYAESDRYGGPKGPGELVDPHTDEVILLDNDEEDLLRFVLQMPSEFVVIGRDRVLVDGLATLLHSSAHKRRHPCTQLRETRRGTTFEVAIRSEGEPTGCIARVAVDLDRVVQPGDVDWT